MKAFWTLFSVLILTFGIAHQADAKRFGGGGFGKSKAVPTQQRQAPQKQDQAQQATPATGAAGKGMLGGLMGGLLAGGIFAYLLGSGAFEGIQFMDILLIALVGFVLFKLLRRRAPQPAAAYAPGAQSPAQPQQRQAFDMGSIGGSAAAAPASAAVIDLPAGFDQQAFIEGALEHYRAVQSAWNSGNLDVIAEYVKPELFAQLANQRQQMDSAPQTDIIDLNAEIVAAGTQGNSAEISLLFRGLARDAGEQSEDAVFDVWHLERDLSKDNAPWLIAGIEAE